ncbi:FAD-dependent oxidoreductase [Modestobacter sp. VKM Ac-2981]|uniref:FAD-dependent oxidoreductase n=1 Tax=unclassified Modestobacter TaxID=2643866 RepID=UPI003FA5B4EB
MTAGPVRPALDVLVVGGGQAGLSIGCHPARRGLRFQIVESGPELGSAWRSRSSAIGRHEPS